LIAPASKGRSRPSRDVGYGKDSSRIEPLAAVNLSQVLRQADAWFDTIARPLVELHNADVGFNYLQIYLDAAKL
jgi:hypothetical protein